MFGQGSSSVWFKLVDGLTWSIANLSLHLEVNACEASHTRSRSGTYWYCCYGQWIPCWNTPAEQLAEGLLLGHIFVDTLNSSFFLLNKRFSHEYHPDPKSLCVVNSNILRREIKIHISRDGRLCFIEHKENKRSSHYRDVRAFHKILTSEADNPPCIPEHAGTCSHINGHATHPHTHTTVWRTNIYRFQISDTQTTEH